MVDCLEDAGFACKMQGDARAGGNSLDIAMADSACKLPAGPEAMPAVRAARRIRGSAVSGMRARHHEMQSMRLRTKQDEARGRLAGQGHTQSLQALSEYDTVRRPVRTGQIDSVLPGPASHST
jgi:hypothetical protein